MLLGEARVSFARAIFLLLRITSLWLLVRRLLSRVTYDTGSYLMRAAGLSTLASTPIHLLLLSLIHLFSLISLSTWLSTAG